MGHEKDGNEVERPKRKTLERTEKHGIAEKWVEGLGSASVNSTERDEEEVHLGMVIVSAEEKIKQEGGEQKSA